MDLLELRLIPTLPKASPFETASIFELIKESVEDSQLSYLSKVVEFVYSHKALLVLVDQVLERLVDYIYTCWHKANIQKEKAP
jgi:hypothetical protein